MYLAQKDEIKDKRNPKLATTTFVKHGIAQDRFDKMIVKFIINGLQPLRSVEDESFKQLIFGKTILIYAIVWLHVFSFNSMLPFYYRHGRIFLWYISSENNVASYFELQN